ncbi:MAG: hypothetical protein AAGF85_00555 [Bacteroidota bacterium]
MKKLEELKTFEDACQVEGLDPEKVIPDFSVYPEEDREAMAAHAKLVIIAKAANRLANEMQPWSPNWDNGKWDKYYPWFVLGGSSGFRYGGYDYWYSYSFVGSRLCFLSYKVAEYVGNQFIDLYKQYFVK